MGDPIVDIEVELRRPVVTQEQANDHRQKLNSSFDQLSQDQAAALLARLFRPNTRVPHDFRRLSRAVRLELMLRLTMRLGTQMSENFHAALTVAGDTPIKNGLKVIFPDYTKSQRDQFLQSLVKGIPTGVPTVHLEFRNRGRFSPDNLAPIVAQGFVPNLLGPLPDTGKNQMEIRGVVTGHRPDAEYRFGRTIEQKSWILVGPNWRFREPPIPAGSDDNTHSGDEDTHPDNDHIYSVDAPGFTGPTTKPDLLGGLSSADVSQTTEAVYMINATETAKVNVGKGPSLEAATLDWFSVTWLEKVDGKWQRKPGFNKIAAGSIEGLEFAGSDQPPLTF
jgi:hypothetical protein